MATHDELEKIVERHCKLYDMVYRNTVFKMRKKGESIMGEIDVYALILNRSSQRISIYEIKSHHTDKGFKKAIHQLSVARDYALTLYPKAKVNTVYVSPEKIKRIYF